MSAQRARRMFHDCAAHKPECPVHERPELPTGCTCQVYSHPLCIFNYCPNSRFCKVPGVGCVSHSQDAAKTRLKEQGGTDCNEPRPTSEPGVGDAPPAVLGDERREEPANASSSSPVLVPMDAERIAALRAACTMFAPEDGNLRRIPERDVAGHYAALRAILRDAGADE